MRDALRERDLERALNVKGGVRVDVADDGTTLVTFSRDYLDQLVSESADVHDDCLPIDVAHSIELDARSAGYQDGYQRALADVKSLAGSAA